MSKSRPWNRSEYTQPPASAGFNLGDASDEEVRAYCLRRSRVFLAKAEDTESVISSDRQLQIAANYAIIAQAFRAGPEPE